MRGLWFALAIGSLCCDGLTPPGTKDRAVELNLQAPPSVITFPGEGRANLIIQEDGGLFRDTITPSIAVTGPFTATWESLRWELRTLKIVSTGVGAGTVTVSAFGKSVVLDISAVAVTFKSVSMTSSATYVTGYPNGCGIATDDRVWCWGGNDSRQLGTLTPYQCAGSACQYGGIYPNASPLRVDGNQPFAQLAVTSYYCPTFIIRICGRVCALTPAGEAWCWGEGFGTPARAAPTITFASVVVGGSTIQSCGLTGDGKAYCFTSAATTPVGDGMSFKSLTVGGSNVCGVSSAGDVWCWGTNYYGVLGIGNDYGKAYATPQRVTTTGNFAAVESANSSSCALNTSGLIYCWGIGFTADGVSPAPPCSNSPTVPCQTTPRVLEGGRSYVAFAGRSYGGGVCGMTAAGEVDCWTSYNKPPVTLALPEPIAKLSRSCGVTATNVTYCWNVVNAVTKFSG